MHNMHNVYLEKDQATDQQHVMINHVTTNLTLSDEN